MINCYMKRLYLVITALVLFSASVYAEEKIKTGLNFAPYPVIGFSTDLGFQYGINGTLYDYGDGSTFPDYRHKFNFEVSRYSRGQNTLKATYNSDFFIPGIRVSAALAYQANPLYRFYGFNGSVTHYDKSLDKKDGVAYYSIDRRIIRAVTTFQGTITNDLQWAAGVNFLSYRINKVRDKYDYDPERSIYCDYLRSGVIRPEEANGGERMEFNVGLVYDSRNALSVPSKGIWAELYLTGSPDVFGDGFKYSKLSARFRHYVGIVDDDRLTFAYHIAYQGLLSGSQPFYIIQNINSLIIKKTINEGLGNKNTIRGTLYNRFLGDNYAWANFELRVKLFSFNAFRQSFYIATNPFFDLGAITRPFRLDAARGSQLYKEATKLHESLGMGIKLVMNRNFVMSVEGARPLNPEDGHFGVNFGSNFIF